MKLLISLTFFFLSFSVLAQEKYFVMDSNEDSELLYETAIESDKFIEIEIEKGTLTCSFLGGKCIGFYDIEKTSSGFVKGFN